MAKGSAIARRTMARMVAVQLFYSQNFDAISAKTLLQNFKTNGPLLDADIDWVDVDKDLLAAIIIGYEAHKGLVDEMLHARTTPEQQNELMITSILRPAIYEIIHNTKTPKAVIISDYMNVASGFFEGRETALINGVLDQVGKLARPEG